MATATRAVEKATKPKLVSMDKLLDRVNSFSDSIARRAFEIFQSRGRADGHDLADWYNAEAELFHRTHLQVAEWGDALTVRAEVPGFHANELEVGIEPRRLAIAGKRKIRLHATTPKIVYCDQCADQIFRVLGLPVDVDPKAATATLEDGILELAMPKAAVSIVPLSDYRVWRDSLQRPSDGRGRS